MIRGMTKKIKEASETPNTNVTANAAIHNRFDIEVIDITTGKVKQKAQAFNVICNKLWANMGSYFKYIQYGDGTGTPSSGDTSLFGYLGGLSASDATAIKTCDVSKRLEGIYSYTVKVSLLPNTAVGKTITEVGISVSKSNNGNLCTHAMLQDMNGNPVSIQKTDKDLINIYATVFLHFNGDGYYDGHVRLLEQYFASEPASSFSFIYYVFGACSHSSTPIRACCVPGSWDLTRNTNSDARVANVSTYDSASKKLTITCNTLQAGITNVKGGIKLILLCTDSGAGCEYIFTLTPGGSWFPYSTITNEAVGAGDGVTKDFELKFDLARNAVIKVDGAAVDATVDYKHTYKSSKSTPLANNVMFLQEGSTEDNLIIDVCGSGRQNWRKMFKNLISEMPIKSFYAYSTINATFYCSNDLVNWVEAGSTQGVGTKFSVPVEYQNYKYWKCKHDDNSNLGFRELAYDIGMVDEPPASYNKCLHFAEPPAEGAVITADYISDTIAKDENHVFNLTLTIQFGEYTEAQ